MENETHMKSQEVKLGVCKVLCLSVKNHGHVFGQYPRHSLGAHDDPIDFLQVHRYPRCNAFNISSTLRSLAEILTISIEYDHTQLTEEIMCEISAKNLNYQDTKGPESFSIPSQISGSPKITMKQMSLLLQQIDSESYPMHMSLIEIIGTLIKEIAMDEGTNARMPRERREGSVHYSISCLNAACM
ncbi:Condensin complex subunit [Tulasnella sp. 418]|nr:Condensin complex subunit [Tulasnella sp. 418]